MGRSKRRAADTSLDRSGDDSGRASRSKRAKADDASRRESGEGTGKLMVRCTTCSQQVVTTNTDSIHQHPFLDVLICKKCLIYFRSGEITQDGDGLDEQCRWCGDGGKLYGCDYCHNAFCKRCILRNFGRTEIALVEGKEGDGDHKWRCYVCAPEKLQELRTTCQEVMSLLEQRREEAERRKEELKRQREEQEKVRAERHEEKMQREMDRRRGATGGRSSARKPKQVSFPSDFCLHPDLLAQLQTRLLSASEDFRTVLLDIGKEVDSLMNPDSSKSEKPEKMEVEGEKEEGAEKTGAQEGEAATAATSEGGEKTEEAALTGEASESKEEAAAKLESQSEEAVERRKLECILKVEQGLTAFFKSVNETLKIPAPKPKKKAPSTPSTPAASTTTPASSTPTTAAAAAKSEEEPPAEAEEKKEEEAATADAEKEATEDASPFSDDDDDLKGPPPPPQDAISASEKFDLMMKKSQPKEMSESKKEEEEKKSSEKEEEEEVKSSEKKEEEEKTKEEPMEVDERNDVSNKTLDTTPSANKEEVAKVAEQPTAVSVKPPSSEDKVSGVGETLKVSQDSSAERNGQHTEESDKSKNQSLSESPVKKVQHEDSSSLCTAAEKDKPNGTETPLVGVTTN